LHNKENSGEIITRFCENTSKSKKHSILC